MAATGSSSDVEVKKPPGGAVMVATLVKKVADHYDEWGKTAARAEQARVLHLARARAQPHRRRREQLRASAYRSGRTREMCWQITPHTPPVGSE
eukprot:2290372-Pleurochrysis_carterae.AAC.1